MSSFLQAAACNGRQPERVASSHLVPRPNLVARLIRERAVPRFLVAPDGFGKSQLAFQYAETVFSFFRVFWISGKSPCFLRDLDTIDIADVLCKKERESFLVIFEDLPHLNDVRAEKFSCLLDTLLECGNEVLVTCAPSCDFYGARHCDRLKLDSTDMLLTEPECQISTPYSSSLRAQKNLEETDRIACVRWGGDDGTELLRGLMAEELPSDILCAIFSILALHEGECGDISAFSSAEAKNDATCVLADQYLYLGINRKDETYKTANISMSALATAFDKILEHVALQSLCNDRETLIRRLADALVVKGSGERACQFMAAFASKNACMTWLLARSRALVFQGCIKPAHDLYSIPARVRGYFHFALSVGQGWRLALLGDVKACVYMCRHTAFSSEAPQSARAGALLAIMCFGKDDIAHRAEEELASMLATIREKSAYEVAGHKADGSEVAGCEEIGDVAGCEAAGDVPGEASSEVGSDVANEVGSDPSNNPSNNPSSNVASDNAVSGDPSSNTASGDVSSLAFWLPGAYTAVEAKKSFAAGLRAWYSAFIQGFFSDALLVAACLFLREIKNATHSTPSAFDLELTSSKAYDEFLTFIYEQVNVCAHQKNVFMQALCLCMFEQARKRGYFNDAEPFTIEAIRSMQEAERLLASQRNAYAQNKALTCENKLDFEVTHPNIFREERRRPTQKSLVAVAPVLHVNLFGGLAVHIGDAQVDARLLRRSKARTLLALLVINKGKELARDGLVQTLWPESELATARKNFYSVWSQLRRALTTPAGTCPYLVRTQSGFHIDAHLLDSDLDHFEAMCRTLMFGHVRPEEWEHLFEQASSWYSGDFLPGENECARIQSMRTSCNERLVDALVSASTRLLSAGEVRGGLWFAREALRHDKTREDSYAALMEAQIAAGQRAAALETYFACRSYLADELGIDPSVHTVRLYRDIIEAEESFQW